ncbi:ABC transporter substrate-binding protein [Advenella kashmirensis WT001]|uniref:ABC transporter substrate-binding protein n=1 Tax=Advenella kashmirensis (strain DSM 17095 / LMG 22695 / WT001) TaxID=1036672 RepID=I3UHF3_ADVKW|nr:ABC transporter substrate-binding protein [Advenella kashmirensis WT001]
MEQLGAQIVSPERQTPESLHKWLAAEVAKWGPILKAENISIN